MSLCRRAPCLIGIALVALPTVAVAEVDEEIGLVYSAPKSCPSADEFFARVAARAPARRVGAARERTFEVTIESTQAGSHGALAIRTSDGLTVREVDGATCDETVSALVVVAALAIVAGRSPAPAPAPELRATSARPDARERPPWLAIGSGLARYHGVVPDWVYGVPAFVEIGRRHGPRMRVSLARTQAQQRVMPVGATEFRWTVGRVDLSPLTIARGRFDVAPSIGVEAGVLDGRGTKVAMPGGGSRLWLAPELALRLRLRVDRFALEIEGNVAAPLIRDRFFIAPGTTVHEVPRLTTGIGLTLAVGFP